MNQPVRRRAVFFIGGYDPKTPKAFFDRLRKELGRFETLWGSRATVSPVELAQDGEVGSVRIETRAEGHDAVIETDFSFLVLDRIVLADFARPLPVRLLKYLRAFADFVLSGTAFRFFVHAWRFALYFLYPFMALLLFAAGGWLAAALTAPWLGMAGILVGLIVFSLALVFLGGRWSTNHLMDLWSFSRDFFRGRRPDAEALMQRLAENIVARVGAGRYDEVLLIGHSTGGMLMIDIAARCLTLDLEFAGHAEKTALLTLGSTALKAGYHPAAGKFRESAQRLVDDDRLEWVEIQCLTDAINFYKTDPATEMGLKLRPGKAFPLVRTVRIKDMLQPEIYRRVKRNLFRVHYQYIFANTKPYWYDFFQVCCGPVFLTARVRDGVVGGLPPEEGIKQ